MDIAVKYVIGQRPALCEVDMERRHPSHVMLDGSDSLITAEEAIALLDAGAPLAMRPPPGAPAYEIHMSTGLDLLVQVRECPACKKRVLFA